MMEKTYKVMIAVKEDDGEISAESFCDGGYYLRSRITGDLKTDGLAMRALSDTVIRTLFLEGLVGYPEMMKEYPDDFGAGTEVVDRTTGRVIA